MTREKFEQLVSKFEKIANEKPKVYKFKVLLAALMGYSYILSVLIAAIAAITVLFYVAIKIRGAKHLIVKLAIPLITLVFIIMKSLWVRLEPPKGISLKKEDSTILFEKINSIRKKLNTRKIHEIILTKELNAALYQYPRFGLFGFYKNYLIIGLPLLMSLNEDEMISVIAHELGHLSGNHSKFASWIYRVKSTWYKLMSKLEEDDQKTTWIFNKFVKWYVPFLDAYSFVLMRSEEYEADKCAAIITNENISANALIKINVVAYYLDRKFWPKIYEETKNQKQPIDNVYNIMKNDLENNLSKEEISKYLNESLNRKTNSYDTHPALSERIKALNTDVQLQYNKEIALTTLHNENTKDYTEEINENWKKSVQKWWLERHEYYERIRVKINELNKKRSNESLNIDEEFEYAEAMEVLEGSKEGLRVYQDMLNKHTNYPPALFAVGRILLHLNDEEGTHYIEKAIESNIGYTVEGCRLIHNYLIDCGKPEEAAKYYNRAMKFEEITKLAKEERNSVRFSENYIAHDLKENNLEEITTQLQNYENIQEVYLIRKDVKYLKQFSLYILGIKFKNIMEDKQKSFVQKIVKEIDFPGEFFIVPLTKKNTPLEEIMKKINGSKIFESIESVKENNL